MSITTPKTVADVRIAVGAAVGMTASGAGGTEMLRSAGLPASLLPVRRTSNTETLDFFRQVEAVSLPALGGRAMMVSRHPTWLIRACV
jgi:hypothetical protein